MQFVVVDYPIPFLRPRAFAGAWITIFCASRWGNDGTKIRYPSWLLGWSARALDGKRVAIGYNEKKDDITFYQLEPLSIRSPERCLFRAGVSTN